MSILPDVDISSLADLEYGKACENKIQEPCPHGAEWFCWVRHGNGCVEVEVFACTPCKAEAEAYWIASLKASDACGCGMRITGQLSDHFRAVKL